MFAVKIVENNAIYSVQELHLSLFSSAPKAVLASFTSSTVSVHSSTNLSTNSVLHLQFP